LMGILFFASSESLMNADQEEFTDQEEFLGEDLLDFGDVVA
jgi:hypothetical protein